VWLAWRHRQFGAGFKAIKHFKPSFLEALGAATAAYPEARVGKWGMRESHCTQPVLPWLDCQRSVNPTR
jgi:hypothetical protein